MQAQGLYQEPINKKREFTILLQIGNISVAIQQLYIQGAINQTTRRTEKIQFTPGSQLDLTPEEQLNLKPSEQIGLISGERLGLTPGEQLGLTLEEIPRTQLDSS